MYYIRAIVLLGGNCGYNDRLWYQQKYKFNNWKQLQRNVNVLAQSDWLYAVNK